MVLFVYGSLTEGQVHFGRIQNFIESIEAGTTKGALYRNKVGFPVLTLEGADRIQGQVVTLKDSCLLVGLLDQFYGYNEQDPAKSNFLRENIFIQTTTGVKSAWVYALNPERRPLGLEYIENGDWQSVLSQKPTLLEKMNDRQKSYVLKLGACSGRDIVPIDLGLYRELMSLELIVDKGRRLALSKVGQELYKYLS